VIKRGTPSSTPTRKKSVPNIKAAEYSEKTKAKQKPITIRKMGKMKTIQ
jgi:hypothetical protein